jgi:hypothetical protein
MSNAPSTWSVVGQALEQGGIELFRDIRTMWLLILPTQSHSLTASIASGVLRMIHTKSFITLLQDSRKESS